MSPATIDEALPSMGTSVSKDIALYLLRHEYYSLLKKATEEIVRGLLSFLVMILMGLL